MKYAKNKPIVITISFTKLNLCPSLLSNKMVVEICKNIPTAIAIICDEYIDKPGNSLIINVPNGVIKANNTRKNAIDVFFNAEFIKNVANIITTGIL